MRLRQEIVDATEARAAGAPTPKPDAGVPFGMPFEAILPQAPEPERTAELGFAGARPTQTEQERLLGTNDLVDEFYLSRALAAAQPVGLVTVRRASGVILGTATGFMVSPSLLLTNWHVFGQELDAEASWLDFEFVYGIDGNPRTPIRFGFEPRRFFHANKLLDFALVAVAPTSQDGAVPLAGFGFHRMVKSVATIKKREWITIIQHPSGLRRQYAIRENQLSELDPGAGDYILYRSDTAPGSSGAPAFNDSFQVVAIHHSGRAEREGKLYKLRNGRKVASLDGIDDALVKWVANEGVRISSLCAYVARRLDTKHPLIRELLDTMDGSDDVMSKALRQEGSEMSVPVNVPAGSGVSIPITLNISVNGTPSAGQPQPQPQPRPQPDASPPAVDGIVVSVPGQEAMRTPFIDTGYETRTGYDEKFLGVRIALPKPRDMKVISTLDDGGHVIPYEHFSIILHKRRRLALVCASNIDGRGDRRKPEPGKDYTRDGLSGLSKSDSERWVTDPRIPDAHQTPDVFYNADRKAFDKGHIIRREDVCWGDSWEQIRKANGDTFHTTNCSPQTLGFNRSTEKGEWGLLENEILKQAKTQLYTIFAGPVFGKKDRWFEGRDERGDTKIQIPSKYWKIVFTKDKGKPLQAYAFVLEQDLSEVDFTKEQFIVEKPWKARLVSIAALEKKLELTFDKAILDADQHAKPGGHEIATAFEMSLSAAPGDGAELSGRYDVFCSDPDGDEDNPIFKNKTGPQAQQLAIQHELDHQGHKCQLKKR